MYRSRDKAPYNTVENDFSFLIHPRDIEHLLFGLNYQYSWLTQFDWAYIQKGISFGQHEWGDYFIVCEEDFNDAVTDLSTRITYWENVLEVAIRRERTA